MKNTYILVDKYVIVFFKNKEKTEFFIIDAEDFDLINSFKNTWKPNVKKGKVESIVIRTQKNKIRKTYKIHNIIMKPPKGFVIDHINGLPIDNRKCNLRICTQAENAQNIHISKNIYIFTESLTFFKKYILYGHCEGIILQRDTKKPILNVVFLNKTTVSLLQFFIFVVYCKSEEYPFFRCLWKSTLFLPRFAADWRIL